MPATDAVPASVLLLSDPLRGGFDCTAHASDELAFVTRAIMVTTAGAVAVVMDNGNAVTIPGLEPGVLYPFRIRALRVSGTTATGVKGFY